MRQGVVVTALLASIALPIAFFADGGWDGVRNDVGGLLSWRPHLGLSVPGGVSGRTAASAHDRDTTIVQNTFGAAAKLARGAGAATAAAYLGSGGSDPFLVTPGMGQSNPANDGSLDLVGDIRHAATSAEIAGLKIASIAAPQDYGAAVKWYSLATDPDNPQIRYAIAREFLDRPIPDYALGARWLQSSAALDDAHAQFDLAKLYVEGTGVTRDYPTAFMWYALARRGLTGEDDRAVATDQMNRLSRTMTPEESAKASQMLRDWQPGAVPPPPFPGDVVAVSASGDHPASDVVTGSVAPRVAPSWLPAPRSPASP